MTLNLWILTVYSECLPAWLRLKETKANWSHFIPFFCNLTLCFTNQSGTGPALIAEVRQFCLTEVTLAQTRPLKLRKAVRGSQTCAHVLVDCAENVHERDMRGDPCGIRTWGQDPLIRKAAMTASRPMRTLLEVRRGPKQGKA